MTSVRISYHRSEGSLGVAHRAIVVTDDKTYIVKELEAYVALFAGYGCGGCGSGSAPSFYLYGQANKLEYNQDEDKLIIT